VPEDHRAGSDGLALRWIFQGVVPREHRDMPSAKACMELRPRMKRGVQRQQFVEFGRAVTDTVGPGDEDLPTIFRESTPFGDRDHNAQADRRRRLFTP
jgi:hypothetical protein